MECPRDVHGGVSGPSAVRGQQDWRDLHGSPRHVDHGESHARGQLCRTQHGECRLGRRLGRRQENLEHVRRKARRKFLEGDSGQLGQVHLRSLMTEGLVHCVGEPGGRWPPQERVQGAKWVGEWVGVKEPQAVGVEKLLSEGRRGREDGRWRGPGAQRVSALGNMGAAL